MLNTLKDSEMLMPHGRIPQEVLDEIRFYYNEMKNPSLAGEIAIAAIEYALCGDTSFDDNIEVRHALYKSKKFMQHNLDSYSIECDNKIIDQHLDDIARMYYYEQMTQQAIGDKLHLTQRTISNRLKAIRFNYPELYDKYHEQYEREQSQNIQKSFQKFQKFQQLQKFL